LDFRPHDADGRSATQVMPIGQPAVHGGAHTRNPKGTAYNPELCHVRVFSLVTCTRL